MSNRQAVRLVIALLSMSVLNPLARGEIRWKGGVVDLPAKTPAQVKQTLLELSRAGEVRHIVVQFTHPVTADERARLEAGGLKLLDSLSNNAFFASVAARSLNADGIAGVTSLTRIESIDDSWKLHPYIRDGNIPSWAVVAAGAKPAAKPEQPEALHEGENRDRRLEEEKTVTPQSVVGAYVKFHPDVQLNPAAANLCLQHGAVVRDQLWVVNTLVIELPFANIANLAAEDGVEWIEPPLPRMVALNDSNRARTGASVVQAPPYGLNGTGVTVLVYDAGTGRATHQDFGGRLTVHDASGTIDHSTHVAGTIGGSGAASGGLRKGMAPNVQLLAYGFQYDGSGTFLYTNPGDIQQDYNEAVNTFGADIASNSIGTNTETNGFPCSIQGDYGVTDTVIDSIVRGSLGAPFRIVWANGNERQGTRCNVEGFGSYYSTAPPAGAKNHITCGALNSNDDSMTSFSSWGPVDDGRMKPDISGPGCQSNDDLGVTSCSSGSDTAYASLCGTSMATPTIAGLSSLLLQDFRAHFPALPDFRNSTLKILLAHTAVDLGNVGPDYQFGYGSVRIQPAIDFMRTGNFLENQVSQGGSYNVLVVVNPTDTVMKVTLAWDDPPGTPNVSPALVNDLDLVVYDPSNNQRFPWKLDPLNPSAAAVRTQANHVDNIEQVVVSSPPPGVYRIEVHGTNVPQGPQSFSLCASPLLVNCSRQGVISLDRDKYACSSTATIRVIDCDLNTNDNVVETVNVSINSTSEPGGETVTLTETGAQTAAFEGTINLSTANSPGVLQVANGDTVTASYVDANDGMGGINVTVTDTAVVDCVAPIISNVQATNIGPRNATIAFTTNEPANGTVRYGTACGSLTLSAVDSGFNTNHSIVLNNLTATTTYYFAIDAVDQAANSATDDNGGACYPFTTTTVPDFYAEIFTVNDNDLHNHTLLFTPNGSISYYAACMTAATSLPTDPAGGTNVSLSDDGSISVTVSGGNTVKLYGTSYGSFFINANGNITPTAASGVYTETLADQFSTPRISALFDDLNPATGGTISWKQLADRVAVTWQNVPEYQTADQNTFQIEMFFDGRIQITWLGIAALDGLAGLSAGGGLSPDFFETDLTTLINCAPLPPVASSMSASTAANTLANITLVATDPTNDPLTYIIVSLPAHGGLRDPGAGLINNVPYSLVGGGKIVRYTPNLGYAGLDSFTFKANDGSLDSNVATISLTVGGPQPVYTFPMNSNPGWTTMGQWAFGQPTGGGSHDHDPTSGFTGTNVYGYNLAGDYPNNLVPVQYLTTTAINCSGLSGVQLRFRRWLGIEAATSDHATIDVSTNGTIWANFWSHTGTSDISENAWSLQTYNISAIADHKPTVYIRWGMGTTNGSATYPGWNIDDVEILAEPPIACAGGIYGDVNHDGLVNAGDIQRFSDVLQNPGAASQADRCAADIHADGVIDQLDRDEFVELLLN